MEEIWKDIDGYEGKYQVSSLGRIKSASWHNGATERLLKLRLDRRGYPTCFLYKDGQRKQLSVHRVVANTFIPNPHNKPQVNHINGEKSDNRVKNLEWCTNRENQDHASDSDLKHTVKVLQLDMNGNLVKEWSSMAKAANALRVTRASIFSCCTGKAKSCKNYIWKYKGA